MQKQEIEIAGYKITQLSKTEFELENKEQNLDFYFEVNEENEVDVFVFDSEIRCSKRKSNLDPFIANFQATTIEEAVKDAMAWV